MALPAAFAEFDIEIINAYAPYLIVVFAYEQIAV